MGIEKVLRRTCSCDKNILPLDLLAGSAYEDVHKGPEELVKSNLEVYFSPPLFHH